MRLALAVVVMIAGCAEERCDHPDEIEYDCAPVAQGTTNTCSGGPMAYDPDKAFPAGCMARLPMCLPTIDSVLTCTCNAGIVGSSWSCPI